MDSTNKPSVWSRFKDKALDATIIKSFDPGAMSGTPVFLTLKTLKVT